MSSTEIPTAAPLERPRPRRQRAGLLLLLHAALVASAAVALGVRPTFAAQDALALALAGAFVVFGARMSAGPGVRLGRWSARAVAAVGILSPLLAARHLVEAPGAPSSVQCLAMAVLLGFAALLTTRLVLGRHRRRTGGASRMQGVAAALAGAMVIGLHCPLDSALHLASHAAGAALVGWGLRWAILRGE